MTTINPDTLRDRLHERLTDPRGLRAYCDNCGAGLTEADYEAGECTNCGSVIADDESADEDLWEE